MTVATESAPLGLFRAIADAVRDRPVDFYPCIAGKNGAESLSSKQVMEEFGAATAAWPGLKYDEGVEAALSLAADSLKEVKAQTEYQDQKAIRLLTVTSFVMALAGVLFTRLNDAYPLPEIPDQPLLRMVLIVVAYAGFGAFLMLSLLGSLVTFHATRTRFKYRRDGSSSGSFAEPLSRLFYQGIVVVRPSIWSETFVNTSNPAEPGVRADLAVNYLRDLVGETYLVACKTADKVRYLDPAQRLLAWALKCLLAWLLVLAVLACVPKNHKADDPTLVRLVEADATAHMRNDISDASSGQRDVIEAPPASKVTPQEFVAPADAEKRASKAEKK